MRKETVVITEKLQNSAIYIRNLVPPKCIVCSFGNGNGLHLEFDAADDGSVTATFQCDEAFEG